MNAKSELVWKERIHETIECYRKYLAILNELQKGVLICQVCLKANNIFKKYTVNKNMEELEQNIRMKLQTKAQQLRRYAKRSNHYQQNKLFDEDTKRFYHQINNQKADVQEPPVASKYSSQ
jgi:hypothetical protein